MITDSDDPTMILMLTAANAPTERVGARPRRRRLPLQNVPVPELVLRVRARPT
jgi:hypothetical protein